jgi:hypothetical protein
VADYLWKAHISCKSLMISLSYTTLFLERIVCQNPKPSPVQKTSETIHNSHPTRGLDLETQLGPLDRELAGFACSNSFSCF